MDQLPNEILDTILLKAVQLCHADKNLLIPMRLVCKSFDRSLRPYFFRCLQLGFESFRRGSREMDVPALERVGGLADSLYLDMMITRDEEEIERLDSMLQCIRPQVPEMDALIEKMKGYCMTEQTFDENEFRSLTETLIMSAPNLTRLKLNLPFQVVKRGSRTTTLLLATTNAILARRPEEFKPIEYLSIEHVSDTCFIDICNNPIDVSNMMTVFGNLKHLILSIKRNESRQGRQEFFASNLWHLIGKAKDLKSLCISGWTPKRKIENRVHFHASRPQVYLMRYLSFASQGLAEKLQALRCLELTRVDMEARSLASLISQLSRSLREVFLNEVYLKGRTPTTTGNTSLWIGYPGFPKPPGVCWVADELWNVADLKLTVLRVSGLGYIDFESPSGTDVIDCYDLRDTTGRQCSFDERFVQAVMTGPDPIIIQTMDSLSQNSTIPPAIAFSAPSTPLDSRPTSSDTTIPISHIHVSILEESRKIYGSQRKTLLAYDSNTYQKIHNTTSWYRRSIDGYFHNHNKKAVEALQIIIAAATHGIGLLQMEIVRATAEGRDLSFWRAPTVVLPPSPPLPPPLPPVAPSHLSDLNQAWLSNDPLTRVAAQTALAVVPPSCTFPTLGAATSPTSVVSRTFSTPWHSNPPTASAPTSTLNATTSAFVSSVCAVPGSHANVLPRPVSRP